MRNGTPFKTNGARIMRRSLRIRLGIRHPYRVFSTYMDHTFSARSSSLSGVNQSSQTARESFSYGMKIALRHGFSAQVGMSLGTGGSRRACLPRLRCSPKTSPSQRWLSQPATTA